ncbi:MAG: Hsp20/alpha crystallin family protein [Planctomycetota bacterium]
MLSALKCCTPTTQDHQDRQPAAIPQRRITSPSCDISESQDAIVLLADMPGVPAAGVDVSLHGDLLTLKGVIAGDEPATSASVWREYVATDYERVFRVGQDLDPERIQATIKDGVLRVELRKRAATQPKKIAVQVG